MMRRDLMLVGLSLLTLGCNDAAPRGEDVGPNAPADGAMEPADGGVDPADGGAEPPPVMSVTCPPANADDRVVVTLDGPGRWRLVGCPEGGVELRFTVPPRTAFRLEATSGPDAAQPAYAHPPGGMNDAGAPEEQHGWVGLNDDPTPVVTLRWVDCWGVESCGAGRYCAPWTDTCFDCADGDEVFDTEAMGAPRTDATPRILDGTMIEGVVCAGFDDWYVVNQAAGQAVSLESLPTGHSMPRANRRIVHAYLADPGAARLSDLVSVPFEDGAGLRAAETDRTVWLRASTSWRPPQPGDEGGLPPPETQHAYSFELGGCRSSRDCLPWWYCDLPDGAATCMQCAGELDATGDHGTEAAPIRLAPGAPVEGSICGADLDWYTFTVAEPAIQVTIAATEGLYARDNEQTADTWFGRLGGRRVFRRGGRGVPDEVVLSLEAASGARTDGETRGYTIETEVLEACDFDVEPPACPDGRVCEGRVCVEGAPMSDSCEVACGRAADCVVSDDICRGIGEEDRDALYAECLGRCAGLPTLATRINGLAMCAEVVDFIRQLDPAFGDRCDGR